MMSPEQELALYDEIERLRAVLSEIAGGAWTDTNGKEVCATHEAIIARRALGF